jgi:outer membrane biosynthesis protein TonB
MHQFGFSTTFTVPNAQTGAYTIIAQQTYESDPHTAIENGKTAQATFTLTTTGATQTPAPTQTPTTPPTIAPTTATPTNTPTPTTPTPTLETTPTPTTEQTQTPQPSPIQTAQPTTNPTTTPIIEQSNTTLYLIAGIIATITAITIALLLIRKRKTTHKTKL